jgi:hypothetical protein
VGVIVLVQVVGADEFHAHAGILVEGPDLEPKGKLVVVSQAYV